MITKFNKTIPKIQGLILLDCWEPQVKSHFFKDKYYINLIDKLKHIQFSYIINSATGLKIDLADPTIANTIKVCEYRDDHPIMRNLLQHSGNEKTSVLLNRYLISHSPTIAILNTVDFVWFCKHHLSSQIQNWLIAGHTWQMCTHSASLGLPRLANVAKNHDLNFYATDYSFCTMTEQTATQQDFEQDSFNWCLIENFGYQLLPQD